MDRTYNVIDSDGHVLEPLDLWQNYIDPAFRDRAPRLFIDEDGKERLRIDGKAFGGRRGLGTLGAVGARDGVVCDDTMTYNQGRKGGFDPHARIPVRPGRDDEGVPRYVHRRDALPHFEEEAHPPERAGWWSFLRRSAPAVPQSHPHQPG